MKRKFIKYPVMASNVMLTHNQKENGFNNPITQEIADAIDEEFGLPYTSTDTALAGNDVIMTWEFPAEELQDKIAEMKQFLTAHGWASYISSIRPAFVEYTFASGKYGPNPKQGVTVIIKRPKRV